MNAEPLASRALVEHAEDGAFAGVSAGSGRVRTLAYVMGARPNFVKLAPVVAALRSRLPTWRHSIIHTGQHYDPMLSDVFLEELGLPMPDYDLGVGSADHGAQTARVLERVERVLSDVRPEAVLVAGDVNSTLAAALAAVKLHIPIGHVEAGLRSFDRTMPEEINRLLVDQISEWCFVHSPEATENLLREGVPRDRIHEVGNTMIDTLVRMRDRVNQSTVHSHLGIARGNYVLVTLHRPALVDGALLVPTLTSLARLAARVTVVFPMHPRTQARVPPNFRAPGLLLIDPVGYVDFVALESGARAVITDSGGVQEETTFLRIPCFTLRDSTERPVTVAQGTNRLLGLEPEAVETILESVPASPAELPAGWDGNASHRIADMLADSLEAGSLAESDVAGGLALR